jgi:hypothetical protein
MSGLGLTATTLDVLVPAVVWGDVRTVDQAGKGALLREVVKRALALTPLTTLAVAVQPELGTH